ncbi:MAG: hypothetical protein EON56_05120, partial [Alphaproteobacteria bacterium]
MPCDTYMFHSDAVSRDVRWLSFSSGRLTQIKIGSAWSDTFGSSGMPGASKPFCVRALFGASLEELARLQVRGDEGLSYSQCLTNKEFGRQAIMADLLYFKYYFLDALRQPYDKQRLIDDFEALANYLTHTEYRFFMFRDFQSRNILVRDNDQVGFIDFQGGMKGAPQYDVASLLWQAKAALPPDWKDALLEQYLDAFSA